MLKENRERKIIIFYFLFLRITVIKPLKLLCNNCLNSFASENTTKKETFYTYLLLNNFLFLGRPQRDVLPDLDLCLQICP